MSEAPQRDFSTDTPIARARRLVSEIERHADQIDGIRKLPESLTQSLAGSGFFRLLMPKSLGGEELSIPEYINVVEIIAKADASTGWCINQGGVLATNSAFMEKTAARQIWSAPNSVLANGPSPTAEAERVDGGYRVSGRWAFSSGYGHATWLAGLAIVTENGERLTTRSGAPVMRHMLFPKDESQLIDTWKVRGLRGTGSHDFSVDNLFVPDELTVWSYGDTLQESGALYLYPTVLLFACGFASVAVGCARGALDALIDFATDKTPRGNSSSLKDQPTVQAQVGEAEGTLRAARAYLHQTVNDVWNDVTSTHEITLDQRVQLRLATTHAIRLAANTVDVCYNAWGSDAIQEASPIQRRFQDIHVVTQHIQGRLAHYESTGRYFLGGQPDRMWL
ncbi:MAG: acyl-CoA dehydrogenase family protein [Gammaproteobacteria bacterium]|nr:acyl-CoA dehydrogenase family protein [Gammaproteobacteria bacterium]